MIAYTSILAMTFSLALIKGRIVKIASLCFLGLLLTTTYYNGSDWRTYELFYNGDTVAQSLLWGAGYIYYMEFFQTIGLNYHVFSITSNIILFGTSVAFFYHHSPRPYFAIATFLLLSGPALFIDSPLRQMMAIPFFLAALHFLIRRQELKFYVAIFMGFFFHESIIFFAPLFRMKLLYAAGVRKALPTLFATILLLVFFLLTTRVLDVIRFYSRHYISNVEFEFGLTIICFIYLFGITLMLKQLAGQSSKDLPLFSFSIGYCFVGLLGSMNEDFLRFNHYLVYGLVLYFSAARGPLLSLSRASLMVISAALFLNITFRDYRYLPYTNYIYATLTNNIMSYDERHGVHLRSD